MNASLEEHLRYHTQFCNEMRELAGRQSYFPPSNVSVAGRLLQKISEPGAPLFSHAAGGVVSQPAAGLANVSSSALPDPGSSAYAARGSAVLSSSASSGGLAPFGGAGAVARIAEQLRLAPDSSPLRRSDRRDIYRILFDQRRMMSPEDIQLEMARRGRLMSLPMLQRRLDRSLQHDDVGMRDQWVGSGARAVRTCYYFCVSRLPGESEPEDQEGE